IVHMSSSLKFMRLATVGCWSGIAMPPVPTAIAPLAERGTCQVDADHHATIVRRTCQEVNHLICHSCPRGPVTSRPGDLEALVVHLARSSRPGDLEALEVLVVHLARSSRSGDFEVR